MFRFSFLVPHASCRGTLVPPIERHPRFHLRDRVVDELDRRFTMSAFVGRRFVERRARLAEMLEGGVHVRLIGGGASGNETGGDDEGQEQCGENSSSHSIS